MDTEYRTLIVASFRLHHEHPAERRRGIQGEAEVEPGCLERILLPAGELEEIIAQHTDDTERDRDNHSDGLVIHSRPATQEQAEPMP
jgi:hypothetical protein